MRYKKPWPSASFAGYSKSISLHGHVVSDENDEGIRHLHSIKPIIFDQVNHARNEIFPEAAIGEEREVTVLGVRPATNRQQDLQVSFGFKSQLPSQGRLEKRTGGLASTCKAGRDVSEDRMTVGTAKVTCFKQPYKLFPWSFQESPGKCFLRAVVSRVFTML